MFKGFVYTPNDYTLELLSNSLLMAQRKYLYSISSEKPRDPPSSALPCESVRLVGHFTQHLYQWSRTHSFEQSLGGRDYTSKQTHLWDSEPFRREQAVAANCPHPAAPLLPVGQITNDSFSWGVRCAPQKGACCQAWPLGGRRQQTQTSCPFTPMCSRTKVHMHKINRIIKIKVLSKQKCLGIMLLSELNPDMDGEPSQLLTVPTLVDMDTWRTR